MQDNKFLTEHFEASRARLRAVAYRMLGSRSEADDAVQEAWLRLSRTDTTDVDNLSGWLTTVVGRICLDMLRSRRSRREESLEPGGEPMPEVAAPGEVDPEREAILSESVGLAMLAVLERLPPAERVAFVLHDVFGVPFEEIAGIVDRSPAAARQLASRGRRRVQGTPEDSRVVDAVGQRHIVEAFFRASRDGDLQGLLAVLDPNAVLRGDAAVLRMGARNGWLSSNLQGANEVAKQFNGRAQAAQLALIDEMPGLVWAPGAVPRVAFQFTIVEGAIGAIDLVAEPAALAVLTIEIDDGQCDGLANGPIPNRA